MSSENNELMERLIAKFSPHLRNKGGIFTSKARGKLLGIDGLPGRPNLRNDFWYDVRTFVKSALIDLELFLETASKDNISQAVNAETLLPIIKALFLHPRLDKAKPEPERAKIAQLNIKEAFGYLQMMSGTYITKSHQRTIEEAIDLCNHLTSQIILQSVSGTQS